MTPENLSTETTSRRRLVWKLSFVGAVLAVLGVLAARGVDRVREAASRTVVL